MRNLLLVFLTFSAACYPVMAPGGGTTYVIFTQRGVMVQGINQCTTTPLEVFSPIRPTEVIARIPPGQPVAIPLQYELLNGQNSIVATVRALDGSGTVLGSVSQSFYIDQNHTRSVQWIIGRAEGGGQDIYISHIRNVC